MATDLDHYIFNYDDVGEIDRMKWQHKVLVKVEKGLFPAGLDPSEITAVADIATGTGDWLNDIAEHFATSNKKDSRPRSLHGFDINATAFAPILPPDASIAIKHTVHDLTKPFPAEFHGKFQLVHVRFTFTFLKKAKVKDAVQNVATLAAKGGYIVWTEVDMLRSTVTDKNNARHLEILQYGKDYQNKAEVCMALTDEVEKVATDIGLLLLEKDEERPVKVLPLETAQLWQKQVVGLFLPNALPILVPEKKDEHPAIVEKVMSDLEEIHSRGHVWDTGITKLVFRKGG